MAGDERVEGKSKTPAGREATNPPATWRIGQRLQSVITMPTNSN